MSARRRPTQGGLWGRQQPIPGDHGSGYLPSNDLDLFVAVTQTAIDPGYVLIGPAEKVFRRDPSRTGHVEPVPSYEAAMVAQMLDGHHLAIGGTHYVTCGRHDGPARSVLVPRGTRDLIARWAHLQPQQGHGGAA